MQTVFSLSLLKQKPRPKVVFIPDNAKEKPMQGKIVAMGPGKKNDKGDLIAPEVKVGDVVLYGKYSGTEVSVDGKTFLIVKESDIFAIL